MTEADLSLTDTDDLLDEVCKRFDSSAFIGLKEGVSDSENLVESRFDGDLHRVAGLCLDLSNQAIATFHAGASIEEEDNEGEDWKYGNDRETLS